jgi:hypothetical protein
MKHLPPNFDLKITLEDVRYFAAACGTRDPLAGFAAQSKRSDAEKVFGDIRKAYETFKVPMDKPSLPLNVLAHLGLCPPDVQYVLHRMARAGEVRYKSYPGSPSLGLEIEYPDRTPVHGFSKMPFQGDLMDFAAILTPDTKIDGDRVFVNAKGLEKGKQDAQFITLFDRLGLLNPRNLIRRRNPPRPEKVWTNPLPARRLVR